ncbi:B- and T-lymphocyte attenuator isoform X2 [Danio rerio]|uniref:B- and T-lymphocyte attenuator isoform X2 n=1 Tax=Danio rerio TaxID=7955 RepID=A0AC58JPV0_DANRE|nr:B- and T-lymphocyte attenuator-like [Danio rerio]|eukprot:XP_005157137.1 B- and T-lymphocyte attenuator-like [Danio rerio]
MEETEMIFCNVAVSLLLLSLSVSGTSNGTEPHCDVKLKVPRQTIFKARIMTQLKINCTVTHNGCQWNPIISWCKIYGDHCKALNHSDLIKMECRNTAQHEGMAFLIFQNITMENSGSYRCTHGDTSVSHAINVTITGNGEDEFSHNQSNKIPDNGLKWLWPYVYICSGIAALVIIIITITLFVFNCQDTKSKTEELTNKNQYMETQSSDLLPPPLPHPRHDTRSLSQQRGSALDRGSEIPPGRGTSSAGRVKERSHHTVSAGRGEDDNALVYASLNHQAVPKVHRKTARQEPELSEYAAVRFR